MMIHKYFVQSDKDPAFGKYNIQLTVVIPVHSLDSTIKGNESATDAIKYAFDSVEKFVKNSGRVWNVQDKMIEYIETVKIDEKSFIVAKIKERGYDIIPFEAKN